MAKTLKVRISLFAGKDRNQVSRIKKLKRRISASFGRLCEYFILLSVSFSVSLSLSSPLSLAVSPCLSFCLRPSLPLSECNEYKEMLTRFGVYIILIITLLSLLNQPSPSYASLCSLYIIDRRFVLPRRLFFGKSPTTLSLDSINSLAVFCSSSFEVTNGYTPDTLTLTRGRAGGVGSS